MHGTGGAATDMLGYWSGATDTAGVILVCPQATLNRTKGWGSTPVERASILAVLREVRRRFPVDPDRVGLTGISMGGHATWEMGMLCPGEVSALFPVCGGPRKELVPLVANLVEGPLLWQCQGARDQPELVRAVRHGIERLERLGGDPRFDLDPDRGHQLFEHRRQSRLAALIDTTRPPRPAKVDCLTLGPPAGQCHWVRVEAVTEDAYQTGDQVELTFRGERPDEDEMFARLWKEVQGQLASVTAWTRGNKVLLKTRHVARVTLLLDRELVDFDHVVLVKHRGKTVWRGRLAPDPVVLLEELAHSGDRRRLVEARVTVDLEPARKATHDR
jgi:dienelactone hydrolase